MAYADDADRRTETRGGEVTGRPQNTLAVTPTQSGMLLAKAAARYAFEAVHQPQERDFRRIVHQQMHVIVFAVHLDKRRREVPHTAANSPRMSFSTLAVKTLRRYLVTKTK